jgi:hypothetical protein
MSGIILRDNQELNDLLSELSKRKKNDPLFSPVDALEKMMMTITCVSVLQGLGNHMDRVREEQGVDFCFHEALAEGMKDALDEMLTREEKDLFEKYFSKQAQESKKMIAKFTDIQIQKS